MKRTTARYMIHTTKFKRKSAGSKIHIRKKKQGRSVIHFKELLFYSPSENTTNLVKIILHGFFSPNDMLWTSDVYKLFEYSTSVILWNSCNLAYNEITTSESKAPNLVIKIVCKAKKAVGFCLWNFDRPWILWFDLG